MKIFKFWTLNFFFLILEFLNFMKFYENFFENFEILWKFWIFLKFWNIFSLIDVTRIIQSLYYALL